MAKIRVGCPHLYSSGAVEQSGCRQPREAERNYLGHPFGVEPRFCGGFWDVKSMGFHGEIHELRADLMSFGNNGLGGGRFPKRLNGVCLF